MNTVIERNAAVKNRLRDMHNLRNRMNRPVEKQTPRNKEIISMLFQGIQRSFEIHGVR